MRLSARSTAGRVTTSSMRLTRYLLGTARRERPKRRRLLRRDRSVQPFPTNQPVGPQLTLATQPQHPVASRSLD